MNHFKNKIVYQIWPRSFQDSNGDGIGDLNGILLRLDYLKELGVDLIWLSPIYMTGNKDYGYDIDDYYNINPEYGTMEDFELLLDEAKKREIGILMDLVANHTSDQHIWFQDALNNIVSPYRNYYFFREGRKHPTDSSKTLPPNNWLSAFGGSAWQLEETTGQYYLTMFTPNQCDLNWENEKVRESIYEIMRFWLEKGIAGFRMDVINTISKAPQLPNLGKSEKLDFPFEYIVSLPKTHDYLMEMNQKVLQHYDCFTVGEGMSVSIPELIKYTMPVRKELNMMFQFDLSLIGCGPLGKYDFRKLFYWNIKEFKKIIELWQQQVEKENGWLGNYLSNHDQPRQVSRFGNDTTYRIESAKALALLNLTLRGTPFIYQGEEIGMTNCMFKRDDWKDFEAINDYKVLQSMMHLPKSFAKKVINKMTRDHARTPMQWDDSEFAGFSFVRPWMKLNPNYTSINVKADKNREDSIFFFYKSLIQLRREYPVLVYGSFTPELRTHKHVICYVRENEVSKLLIVINLSPKSTIVDFSELSVKRGTMLITTCEATIFSRRMRLKPYEGFVYEIIV